MMTKCDIGGKKGLLNQINLLILIITSRDRPKSAPYLRLKYSKKTSKCQSIGELGTLLWKKIWKKSHNAEKTENEDPLGLLNIHFVAKLAQNWKVDPLVSPGNVCYAEKKEKPFWFSSLGQQVKFEIL